MQVAETHPSWMLMQSWSRSPESASSMGPRGPEAGALATLGQMLTWPSLPSTWKPGLNSHLLLLGVSGPGRSYLMSLDVFFCQIRRMEMISQAPFQL